MPDTCQNASAYRRPGPLQTQPEAIPAPSGARLYLVPIMEGSVPLSRVGFVWVFWGEIVYRLVLVWIAAIAPLSRNDRGLSSKKKTPNTLSNDFRLMTNDFFNPCLSIL
jgi:hypothetical protein